MDSSVAHVPRPVTAETAPVRAQILALQHQIGQTIHGKDELIELAIVTLLAGGHLLIEDVPGVGKSTMARALAAAAGGEFRRIQFTSDLLPADLIGVSVLGPGFERAEFRPGPLFSNFVLADEINRAPPRTQSALLEAMAEQTISVDGISHPLPTPFMVIATQNPGEHHGTYPLPESQRDRFMVRMSMGYTCAAVEAELLRSGSRPHAPAGAPATSPAMIIAAQSAASCLFVHSDLASYAQTIVQATRTHRDIRLGVSTRGAMAWIAAARARAWLHGQDHVSIDDLQELAQVCLAHRLLPMRGGDEAFDTCAQWVAEIVSRTDVPR